MVMKISSGVLNYAKEMSSLYDVVPTNLLQIADDELINVIYDNYGSNTFDGLTMFEPTNEEFYIHINTERGNTKENGKGRFTLAHELGHYFIPLHRLGLMTGKIQPHGSLNYLYDSNAWQIERDADAFASSLLMPEESVTDFIYGKSFNFGVIDALAKRYLVSKSAAAIRFAAIGNYPIMVVYALKGKVMWVIHSEDFPFSRLRNGNAKGDEVPKNTVMGDYFFRHANNGCNEEIVYAGDCFDTRQVSDNDRIFIEWSIPFGDRALSVFWER